MGMKHFLNVCDVDGAKVEPNETILCTDKEDAKTVIDNIGGDKVKDWEFLEGGKVRLILNCKLAEID